MGTRHRALRLILIVILLIVLWAVNYNRKPVGPPPQGATENEAAPEINLGGENETAPEKSIAEKPNTDK